MLEPRHDKHERNVQRMQKFFFSWKLFFTFSLIYDVLNRWRVFVTKPTFIADLFRWQLSNKGDEIGRDISARWGLSGADYSLQSSLLQKQKPNLVWEVIASVNCQTGWPAIKNIDKSRLELPECGWENKSLARWDIWTMQEFTSYLRKYRLTRFSPSPTFN